MATPSRVTVLYDDAMVRHDPGPGHPERPERLKAIVEHLSKSPVDGVTFATPNAADRKAIERIHDEAYLDVIESVRGRTARLDEDTATSPESVDAAYLAAGAAVDAVNRVVHGSASPVFALVRPPGHHAERDRAMGFCLFNNIAIAAAHAVAKLNIKRVLIVDWDVHHGNGTQHSFESRRDVLVFNAHQHRLFPNTGDLDECGEGVGLGYTVNCPLPPGTNDATYIAIFERLLMPIAAKFEPELVLVSAGFDAHRDDPLGGMSLTEQGFARLCAVVKSIADRHAGGRLALMLEGGYNLNALARSMRMCLEVLTGEPPAATMQTESVEQDIVNVLLDYHRRFWPI